MTYPHTTGYVAGSETSKASAEMFDESGSAKRYKEFIIAALKEAGDYGMTVDEMTIRMKADGFPQTHNGSVAGVFVNMEKLFLLKPTNEKRQSSSGRMVTVYVSHDGTPREIKLSKRDVIYDELTICRNFLDGLVRGKQINGGQGPFANRAPEIVAIMDSVLRLL